MGHYELNTLYTRSLYRTTNLHILMPSYKMESQVYISTTHTKYKSKFIYSPLLHMLAFILKFGGS